jgi:asparagine synthetase B (glutamine-hydrolysing)
LAKAREIALAKGAEHVALELSPEHYAEILEPSVRTVGGMYNYDHGLFYGFNKAVSQKVDMSFHGHGFDYMFQGMYIPGKNLKIGNKTLYYRTLYTPPDDLTEYFINNVSYRIKNADIWSFVRKDKRKRLSEFQRSSIADVLNEGKKLTENVFDLWEYLTFHHISRHYSYPNHASIATFVEQRTASFTNMLFDLYLKLPVEQRFNGKIEKECLKILNPALAAIWSANTNLPVTASCLTQTVYQIAGFFKRRVIPEKKHPEGEWAERTWPSREYALRTQKGLKYALKKLCESDVLDVLEFLDTEKIRDGFPRWADGEDVPGISGDFVQAVLTAGTFLKQ